MKEQKIPSDWLILPNLLMDALHGLGMCVPLYLLTLYIMFKGSFFLQFSFLFISSADDYDC